MRTAKVKLTGILVVHVRFERFDGRRSQQSSQFLDFRIEQSKIMSGSKKDAEKSTKAVEKKPTEAELKEAQEAKEAEAKKKAVLDVVLGE